MASYTNANRLTGLASGTDTDSYVQKLMYAASTKYYNYQRNVQKLQWKQTAYRDVAKKIQDFQSKWLDITSSSSIRMQKNFTNKYTSEVTDTVDGSSSKAISVSDIKKNGSHTIKVESAATTAKIVSSNTQNEANRNAGLKSSDTLAELGFDNANGVDFQINGKKITISKDTKISEFVDKVNASGAGVKMGYNKVTGAFTFETLETGKKSEIKFGTDDFTKNALGKMGFSDVSAPIHGEDAKLVVDGVAMESATNKLEFDEFTADITYATVGKEFTVKTGKDTDAIYNMVSDFVKQYNELVTGIRDTSKESRVEGPKGYYEPLTDDEKKEMKEDDIEKWEKEAKKGILHSDSILTSFLSDVRSTFYSTSATNKDGNKTGLYNMGITTTSNYLKGGLLEIDEEKVKKAINDDPDTFIKLMGDIGDKLNDVAKNYIGINGKISNKAGIEGQVTENDNTLYTQINSVKDKMSRELTRLKRKEERYYEMFAQMESFISKNNTTLDSIYSFMG